MDVFEFFAEKPLFAALVSFIVAIFIVLVGHHFLGHHLTKIVPRRFSRVTIFLLSIMIPLYDQPVLPVSKFLGAHYSFLLLWFLVGLYIALYLQFNSTEESIIKQLKENEAEAQSQASIHKNQRDILSVFNENISNSIREHLDQLDRLLTKIKAKTNEPEQLDEVCKEAALFESVASHLTIALRDAIARFLPPESKVVCTLFLENEDELLMPITASGEALNVVKDFWEIDKSQFIRRKGVSSATEAADQNILVIDADTNEAHENGDCSFHYLGKRPEWEKQKRFLQSLATIPISFDPHSSKKAIICISSCIPLAIDRPEVRWLIEKSQGFLEPRFRLVYTQRQVLEFLSNLPSCQKQMISDQVSESFQRALDQQIHKIQTEERAGSAGQINQLREALAQLLQLNSQLTAETKASKAELKKCNRQLSDIKKKLTDNGGKK